MRFPGTSLAILATMGCVCSGLVVGPVRLINDRPYITYGLGPSPENSTLECPYQLEDEGEVVQRVSWTFWEDEQEVGSFEWQPSGGAVATGRLDTAVNLGRTDGSLELTTLRYDLGGYYSCALTLTNGKIKETEKFESLIIDTTSNHIWSKQDHDEAACEFVMSYGTYAVFPEPTVHAGMYSESRGGFYDEVTGTQWLKTVYPNNSVAYSFNTRHFKIDADTPTDAKFKLKCSVVKDDGTNIPLFSSSSESPLWTTKGCPAVKVGEDQKVKYRQGTRTCRGEYTPDVFDKVAEAVVTCVEGYQANGTLTSEKLLCSTETLTWSSDNQNLTCVMDGGGGGGGGDGGASCLPSLAILLLALLFPSLLLPQMPMY